MRRPRICRAQRPPCRPHSAVPDRRAVRRMPRWWRTGLSFPPPVASCSRVSGIALSLISSAVRSFFSTVQISLYC